MLRLLFSFRSGQASAPGRSPKELHRRRSRGWRGWKASKNLTVAGGADKDSQDGRSHVLPDEDSKTLGANPKLLTCEPKLQTLMDPNNSGRSSQHLQPLAVGIPEMTRILSNLLSESQSGERYIKVPGTEHSRGFGGVALRASVQVLVVASG